MPVVAIANQKGGVGKTTTALGLAAALGKARQRVTVVDLDPQATATGVLPADIPEDAPRITDLLRQPDAGLQAAQVDAGWPGVSVVPGELSLAAREDSPQWGDERLLRDVIAASDGAADWVIIDTPPSLKLLTLMALVAADGVLLVTKAAYADLKGTQTFLDKLDLVVQRGLNEDLELKGVIVSMHRKTREQAVHMNEIRSIFGERMWEPVVPATVAAEAMATRGDPPAALRNRHGGDRLDDVYDALAARLMGAFN